VERKLYEANRFDIAGEPALTPRNAAAGTTSTGWFGMTQYDRAEFLLIGGVANDAAATLDAAVWQATSAAGANAKALVTPKGVTVAITQVTAGAGFATRSDFWILHVMVDEMDVNNGFSHLQLRVTVSAQDTWYIGALCHRETRDWEDVPYAATEIVN
jgi:hypothetical protein